MFHLINEDIYALIKSFQRKSYWRLSCPMESAYWKNRFTQDVVSQLDKGYRLVCVTPEYTCLDDIHPDFPGPAVCPDANCYSLGECNYCNFDFIPQESVSYAQICTPDTTITFRIWNLEQYKGLSDTLYGLYATNTYRYGDHQLRWQIRESRLYRKVTLQSRIRGADEATTEALPYIAELFA